MSKSPELRNNAEAAESHFLTVTPHYSTGPQVTLGDIHFSTEQAYVEMLPYLPHKGTADHSDGVTVGMLPSC